MEIPKELRKFGLESPSPSKTRRIILTSEGGPKVGKTDMFFRKEGGFPKPRLFINIDLNDESITDSLPEDDDTLIHRVVVPAKHDKDFDRELVDKLVELYALQADRGTFRSVMIDEGVALYTLLRRGFLDGLDFGDSDQKDYTPINSRMTRFYTLAKQKRFNLYIPHRQKRERAPVKSKSSGRYSSQETGRMVCGGWKDALYETQCHLLLTKDPKVKIGEGRYEAEILQCVRGKVEGKILRDEEIALPIIGTMVFPNSEEEDWQ